MSDSRRRIIMIDQHVQGALILRAVLYWFYCLLSVSLMVFCWTIYQGPPRPFSAIASELLSKYAPALAASCLLLPMVMVDVVRFSHLFVGPMHRLKWSITQLAKGEPVKPLAFREDDFWSEFADSFNQLLADVQSARQSKGASKEKSQGESSTPAGKAVACS